MKKVKLAILCLTLMSISIFGEGISEPFIHTQSIPNNTENNSTEFCEVQKNEHQPIEVRSVRGILGENDLMAHTKGQIRAGYITFSEDGASHTSAYGLAGHYHFDTKRWNGFKVGAEAYTVLNLGIDQSPLNLNADFFDENGKSFILLSQAYLDWKSCNTEIKLGRQSLDTPHADSDDIRMMPNYFEAYTITNTDIDNLTLSAGLIDKMAGWENGANAQQFVNVGKTLGTKDIDGIFYAAASYDGIKDLSLSLWYYNYNDIATVIYAEAGYSYTFSKDTTLTLGFQYDRSADTGAALLGEQDANTYGISMELALEQTGVNIFAAYNRDNSETGTTGLSLGGGPFFTSMEDQTLDALGTSGKAWTIGAGFHFSAIGIEGLVAGVAYGNFKADDASLYESNEIDAVIDYSFNDKITVTAALASVDFKAADMEDYDQIRVIANYNF